MKSSSFRPEASRLHLPPAASMASRDCVPQKAIPDTKTDTRDGCCDKGRISGPCHSALQAQNKVRKP